MFGFLNCNKPIGFSSRDLVNAVQGRLRGKRLKIGHCGTLDPLADGVLVLALGAASRLVPYVHQLSKSYRAEFRLGAESPTGDLEAEPTIHPNHPQPARDELEQLTAQFIGEISQTPPAYSAVKIGGRRAYDMARQGKQVDVPARQVHVHAMEIRNYDYPLVEIDITCGTGTYIRSLGIDLAAAAGTTAVMTQLTRTRVGDFKIEDALSIDDLRRIDLEPHLAAAAMGVHHLPRVSIEPEMEQTLVHGLPLPGPTDCNPGTEAAAVNSRDGKLTAIVVSRSGKWFPKRVFCVRDASQ
ncbi:MAG: tRNA pseudouridine(55) synthase TruB [Planctomycetota bacterium]